MTTERETKFDPAKFFGMPGFDSEEAAKAHASKTIRAGVACILLKNSYGKFAWRSSPVFYSLDQLGEISGCSIKAFIS